MIYALARWSSDNRSEKTITRLLPLATEPVAARIRKARFPYGRNAVAFRSDVITTA